MCKSSEKFRIQTKKLFITYSQTDGVKENLLEHLDKLLNIKNYIVAKENHKEEGTHFHCYLELGARCNIVNPRYLDWNEHHPKIEKAKSSSRAIRYCKKDGDYITNLSFDSYERARDLAKDGNWKEGLKVLIDEQPQEIRYLDKWETNLKKVARIFAQKTQKSQYNKEDFHSPPKIEKWDRQKTALVITGRSGIGKTQFAKTLFKNPLLVRHMDKLKKFDEIEHDAIIFDDMSFGHWPRESCIHLLDLEEDSDINVKCGMVTIPSGTPRVITSNRDPNDIFSSFDKAIRRRIHSVRIEEDIRRINNPDLQCYGQEESSCPEEHYFGDLDGSTDSNDSICVWPSDHTE